MTESHMQQAGRLTQEQEALAMVVQSRPDAALVAFEKTLANLPSDRSLPVAVRQQVLDLVTENPDIALKVVMGIQNAGISKGMGTDEKANKISKIIGLIADEKLSSDPKFIADLIQVCTYDSDSDPVSVAALINKGMTVSQIIKLQEAGKSVDHVAGAEIRGKFNQRMEDDIELLIKVTDVCNLLCQVSNRFNRDQVFDRLARISAGATSPKEFNALIDNLLSDLDPEKTKKIDLKIADFSLARTLGVI